MTFIREENHFIQSSKSYALLSKVAVRCGSAHASYTPNGTLHRHYHHEILIIRSGSGTHLIDDKTYNVESNQIFFLRPGQIHQFKPVPGTEFFFVAIDNEELSMMEAYTLSDFEFFHSFYNSDYIVLNNLDSIIDIVTILELETSHFSNEVNHSLLVCSYLSILLIKLQREFLSLVDYSSRVMSNELLQRFNILIDSSSFCFRFVKDYADCLHVSSNYLNEVVKKLTGKSASYWIYRSFVLECKRRLKTSPDSIFKISHDLGFKEPTHFTRFFKRFTGLTPRSFRG